MTRGQHYGGGAPETPEDVKAEVYRLHGEGFGRNEIAARVQISRTTVTAICHKAGLRFDGGVADIATAARQARIKALRAELELLALEDAYRLRQQLWEPTTHFELGKFGGGQEAMYSEWVERELPQPLPADQLKIVHAAGLSAGASLKLAEANRETGTDQAKSMIVGVVDGLRGLFKDAQEEESAEDG